MLAFGMLSVLVRILMCAVTLYLGWRLGLGVMNRTPGPIQFSVPLLVVCFGVPMLYHDDIAWFSPWWSEWVGAGLGGVCILFYLLNKFVFQFGPLLSMSLAMLIVSPFLILLIIGGIHALLRPRYLQSVRGAILSA